MNIGSISNLKRNFSNLMRYKLSQKQVGFIDVVTFLITLFYFLVFGLPLKCITKRINYKWRLELLTFNFDLIKEKKHNSNKFEYTTVKKKS